MKEIEREIAVRLAWYRNHMAKTDQATPSALDAASTHCHEVELELLERKLEVLKREVEQSLVAEACHLCTNEAFTTPHSSEQASIWFCFCVARVPQSVPASVILNCSRRVSSMKSMSNTRSLFQAR
jgi:hypothetical protein